MCGRYSNTGKKGDDFHLRMAEVLGAPLPDSDHGYERFNIAPTQEVLVAVEDEHGRRMEHMRWGLVPSWAKDGKSSLPDDQRPRRDACSSARPTETSCSRPSTAASSLADGWYEWQSPEDPKQHRRPLHFSLTGRRAVLLRGTVDRGRLAELHDRHVRGERPGAADPRPHAGGPGRSRRHGTHGSTRRSTVRPSRELLAPLASGRLAVRPRTPGRQLGQQRRTRMPCAWLRQILPERAASLHPLSHAPVDSTMVRVALGVWGGPPR